MFVRFNALHHRSDKCSVHIDVHLFKSFCLCQYDYSLKHQYIITVSVMNKFDIFYHKHIKMFFGFRKYDSVIEILFMLGLSSFNILLNNDCQSFINSLSLKTHL